MGELTLRQLEYFVAVVDAGSVTAASKKVNVTQATVSMAIAQLESRLGTDLLIRQQSKGVVPTRAGRELSARARHVVAMTAEIEQVAATGTSEISGVLEIGCVSSLSPQVVPPLAAHFARHYPQVTFNYREGSAGDLQQVLIDGALDMAFVFSRQTLEAVHSHDITEAILKIMLPAKHPLGSKKSISFSEVAHESAPRIRWTSTNLATVMALVANGLGYSLRYALPGETNAPGPGVIEIPVADTVPKNAITAVVPRGIHTPRRVDEAIRFLSNHFSETERADAEAP
jgi:DNA-binding transcriptional LysR family regulator